MKHSLFRLVREIRTALMRGGALSRNDTAFMARWINVDESHYTDVSEDDRRRIKAIHAHLWPTLSQGDA